MTIAFVKAQALGNDFIIIEGEALSEEAIRHLADRRFGVGCDQVIFYQRTQDTGVVNVQFFNADGSQANACGNGSRTLLMLLAHGSSVSRSFTLQVGERRLNSQYNNEVATVNMGHAQIFEVKAPFIAHQVGEWCGVDVGNPHLIAFVEDLNIIDIAEIGPILENHPSFPQRVNVSVAQIDKGRILLKTWERGAGYTGACGTAACATVFLAAARGMGSGEITVTQQGGDLTITSTENGILMAGTAKLVFKGEIL